jgi:hypothetical protein
VEQCDKSTPDVSEEHSSNYEEYYLLTRNAEQSDKSTPTFRKNIAVTMKGIYLLACNAEHSDNTPTFRKNITTSMYRVEQWASKMQVEIKAGGSYVPPKRRWTYTEVYGVTSQKTVLFNSSVAHIRTNKGSRGSICTQCENIRWPWNCQSFVKIPFLSCDVSVVAPKRGVFLTPFLVSRTRFDLSLSPGSGWTTLLATLPT